jgi:MFS family permease
MRFFQKGEWKLLWPFYLDSLISPMLFFAPAFLVVYFLSLDFSLFQIGILLVAPSFFALLLEIPTGAVADLYGRKFSSLFGVFFSGVSFFMMFFTTNFYLLLVISASIGVFATFSSGAHEAWTTDLIKKRNKKLLHDYFIKIHSIDSFALVFSGLIGAFLVGLYGVKIIFPVTALSFIVSFFILLFGEEYYVRKKTDVKKSYVYIKYQTKKSVKYSFKHPVLFYFFLASFILFFGAAFSEGLTWTPFLLDLGFPDYAFGYLWSAISIVMMISPWVSKKFMKRNKERKFIVVSLVISTIITLFVLIANSLSIALLITISSLFFFSMKKPAERILFHKFIPNKLRATIGSVEAMIISLAVVISGPIAGLVTDIIGPRYAIFLGGILTIPAIIVYWKIEE